MEKEELAGRERYAAMWSMLTLATRSAHRARGLLLTQPGDGALLLIPCNDVHTVGMRNPIDVAFVDKTGCVLEVHRAVGPVRRLRNRQAAAVVERFASCDVPWFSEGDQLAIVSQKGERL